MEAICILCDVAGTIGCICVVHESGTKSVSWRMKGVDNQRLGRVVDDVLDRRVAKSHEEVFIEV